MRTLAVPANWRHYEMVTGEVLAGVVLRLPSPGAQWGNRLFLETDDGVVAISATAKKGHTVLERKLQQHSIGPGDEIEITYRGMCRTQDGEREYRSYFVRRSSAARRVVAGSLFDGARRLDGRA